MKNILYILISISLTSHLMARPDGHAPIGVMADHAHKGGELMVSYRYMFMNMNQNYAGTEKEDSSNIVAPNGSYAVSPTEMTMQMHMIGLMFAPIDQLTIMAMVPILQNEMSHTIAAAMASMVGVSNFTTKSSGLGDAKITALHPLLNAGQHKVLLGLGVGIPTGSITSKDDIPVPAPTQQRTLPYPMQLGSGSTDLLPSATYTLHSDAFSLGLQASGVIRLNDNSAGYRLGNQLKTNLWFAYKVADLVSASLRAQWQSVLDIKGADSNIAQRTPNGMLSSVPTAQPNLRASDRLDLFLGINLFTKAGPFMNQRLAVEVGLPAWQRLDGQNLGTGLQVIAGYQSTLVDLY